MIDTQRVLLRSWTGGELVHNEHISYSADTDAVGWAWQPEHEDLVELARFEEAIAGLTRQVVGLSRSCRRRIDLEAEVRRTRRPTAPKDPQVVAGARYRLRVMDEDGVTFWSAGSTNPDTVGRHAAGLLGACAQRDREDEIGHRVAEIASGRTTEPTYLLLSGEVAGAFIHEVVGHAAEADVAAKVALREHQVVPNLTVVDDPGCRGAYGHQTHDSNGREVSRTVILENGGFGRVLGATGHDTSRRFASAPGVEALVRQTHMVVTSSGAWPDRPTERVLVPQRLNRGHALPHRDFFALHFGGLGLLEDPLTTYLGSVRLSGSITSALQSIVWMGGTTVMTSAHCWKKSQRWPVSFEAPEIMLRVGSLSVAGESGLEVNC